MKLRIYAAVLALVLSLTRSHADTVTLTVITNPPQGGTATGAGTYPTGSSPTEVIQAASGWYVSNVVMNPADAIHFRTQVISLLLQHGDLTTITNDTENPALNSDNTLTVTFAPLFPNLAQPLTDAVAVTGSQVTLSAGIAGRQPIYYQWQKDGQVIPNATNVSLVLTNVALTNSGTYTLIAGNSFGTTNASLVLSVKDLLVVVNGGPATKAVTNIGNAQVSLVSRFTNGPIFYTLDGTTPDFTSTPYTGPFTLTASRTVRAIGYRGDFLQTALSDAIPITVIPVYTLSVPSYDAGGTVTVSPSNTLYASGTSVTVTASPDSGWSFLGYSGDLSGGASTNTFTITRNMAVTALFGTTLSNSVVGNGSLSVYPNMPLFAYGSFPILEAIPGPSNYFVAWGGALLGNVSPATISMTSPNPTVSALFAPVPAGKVTLTVLADGGTVLFAIPTNLYSSGATNLLTASTFIGQRFINWSGNVSGTNNPLPVTVTSNMVITAHFSKTATLWPTRSGNNLDIAVDSTPGTVFRIDTSSNFTDWLPLLMLTNFVNPTVFSDRVQTNVPLRVYRASAQ